MAETCRTFLALPLAEAFSEEITAVHDQLRGKIEGVKWVEPKHVHLTLHFFGNLTAEEIEYIKDIMRRRTEDFSALDLGLDGIGCFPNHHRPRVIWIGITGDVASLVTMQRRIQKRLARAKFPVEERDFRPHATIGRVRKDTRPPPFEPFSFPPTRLKRIDHLILFRSHLSSSGPCYEPLEIFPLGCPKTA